MTGPAHKRPTSRQMWTTLARELVRANAAVRQAHKVATRTNDSDIRLCYCEAWLASLMNIARSLP